MENALNPTQDNSIFSVCCFGGRYPIGPKDSHCTVDIINTETNKVVVLGNVDKNKTKSLLEDEMYKIISDPNHLIESFNKYLDKELMKNKKMINGINDYFKGIRLK